MAERRKGLLTLIMQGFVLLSILATLGIAIAILVTTLNVQKQQKVPIVVYNGTGNTNGNQNQNGLQIALNVPPPKEIQTGSPQYSSYTSVVTLLKQGLNATVSPCDDFYTYTCGAWNTSIGFYTSDTDNYNKMIAQMQNPTYVQSAPLPVQQTVKFFNQCVYAQNNWNTLTANGIQVTNALNILYRGDAPNGVPSFPFPMLDQKTASDFPNASGMGYLFGVPQGTFGNVITPVSGGVDTNWVDAQGQKGYALFIDQPSTMMPYTYYVKSWGTTQQQLVDEVIATMNAYVATQKNKKQLDQKKLASDAADLVNFDYALAMNFSTDSTTRRKYARSYNPMTIAQLQATYKNINWQEFITFLLIAGSGDAQQVINNPNYQYIVMEPTKLQMLNDALVKGNSYGITPNTLLNYVFYSAVRSQSSYLPRTSTNYDHINGMKEAAKEEKKKRRRSGVVTKTHTFGFKDLADPTVINQQCAAQTMEYLQWANARIFIDNIYPTQDSRDSMRTHVAKVASSILIGFRSMIDQLNWMSGYTKKGAYNKIENLVKNIAYPDWITDNDLLTAYYSSLGFNDTDTYFDMVNKANTFNLDMMWSLLVKTGPADRTDFNGPPGTTNAWYQPEVNSITFPAGILHQPFYDANWPASVNFGAMGVIAGHELTHGFDDEGVQWDGVGVLKSWMDASSQSSFNTMADCVVKEYSNFCPLQNTSYAAKCVDGAQTQGENIADNGGIHAAFRAYKNYINLNGPDPLLPDGTLQGFTADQLFFLGFAQVWCQAPSSDAALERQLLVDPHSPSNFRVFGTIQNFPAFKDAFNCPSSKYAPDQHCNVWVSDISSSYGVPAKDANSLNIADPQPAKQGSSQYTNYQSVIQLFRQGMNTTVDPCNNFYAYTCGAWNSPDMSFDVSDNDNFNKMAQQMTDPNYIQSTVNISTIRQVIKYFNECVAAQKNWPALVQSGSQPALAVNTLMGGDTSEDGHRQPNTTTTWPMYDQSSSYATLPDILTMGYLLGQPTGYFGISTLISAFVDTNWVNPQGPQGYSYYIDQPTTMLPNTYYHKIWDQERGNLISSVISTMNLYAKTQGKTLDQSKLQRDAADIVNFDYVLAMNFSTDDTTRRNYGRSYNPMTLDTINGVAGLQETYPFILWHEFIPLSMHPSDDSKFTTLDCRPNGACSSNYTFIVMEPDQLKKLNDLIVNVPNNAFGVSANTVMNYIYYNQMASQASFLPWSLKNEEHVKAIKMHKEMEKPLPGKRRRNSGTRREKRKWAVENDDLADIQQSCAAETMGMLQYANARVFIDKIYPQQADRDSIRNNVAKVASSILIGFRSMIDQLSWMTPYTKKGAYSKIENLVKNIAYPDWITVNSQLDAYHATLGINDNDTYFDVYNKANTFSIYQMFEQLSTGSADRTGFNGPPGTTNAWYQPELNSITFPAAILRQPFYDANWPASVNFGAMGVIAGHELTHGFDDQGVQWDGVGDLRGWMDSTSQASFNNMSACVVNEYSGFCPLDKNTYGAGACVDGAQTQGENIADNGGIHAAFRAYKNYINLNGPDPQLPDGQLEGYTADQLFFMAFAQVWCQMTPSDAMMERQLLVDVHSPSIYRVFGTIQNFAGFKDAFHCPANSAYAPDQHCNVWVSDISSSYGLPAKDPSSLNVLEPQPAIQGSNQYSNYQSVIQLFKQGLKTTVNPCDDFYQYTCGAWSSPSSFGGSDTDNYNKMVQQMQNQDYVEAAPVPVQDTVALFNQCLYAEANWNNLTADGAQITNALNAINEGDGRPANQGGVPANAYPFPMLNQTSSVDDFPNAIGMGYLFGRPQGEFGNVITPISAYVDTNWVNPQGQQGYALFIDQPVTLSSYTYYTKTWDTTRPSLIQSVVDTMNAYVATQNSELDQAQLLADATDLVNFDYMLAMTFSTDQTTRRQFARNYNPMTMAQLQATYKNINWHEFIPFLLIAGSGDAQQVINNPNYQYIVMEPTKLQMLNDALVEGNSFGITPNTLLNYIFYSVVHSQSGYLPRSASTFDSINKMKADVKQSKKRRRTGGIVAEKHYFSFEDLATQDGINRKCAAETMEYLQYANARIFIDNIYTPATRDVIRAQVAKVASSIVIGFRSMIDQLDWMTTSTKKGAYNKIDNLVKNVAYPDWITDNDNLTAYYSSLGFNTNDTYFDMVNKANTFNLDMMWNQLVLVGPTNRLDFLGPPGTTNAWYQPELNSITFPAGILHQPFYDANWPASVNFGAMGVIAGHELTHGFDDQGVQWDGVGTLKSWMDDSSQKSFNAMADCVVQEYSNFCPLKNTSYGAQCVDGAQTQGENIADNGGIHAAFRAYKNYISLNGPDPQLPDGILEGFTADQLFFMGFAQVWCQTPPSNDSLERQILVDPHSPSVYRVFGSIQNFPAFKDAFHCPANTNYAPDKHCNVWVSDINSNIGLPPVDSTNLNIRDPQPPAQGSSQYTNYKSVVQLFKQGMNTQADPCNDFYAYTCGAWNSPEMSFDNSDDTNIEKMAIQMMNATYYNSAPKSVKQCVDYFNACVTANSMGVMDPHGSQAKKAVGMLLAGDPTDNGARQDQTSKNPWPMYDQTSTVATIPDALNMGYLLGYPTGTYGVETLVSAYVDTNWVNPQGSQGYSYFIDQPTTMLPRTYYVKSWDTYRNILINNVIATMKLFAKTQGKTLNMTRLTTDATDLVNFDYLLAMNYSTDDTTRRNYTRSYNPMSINDLKTNYPNIDWTEFLKLTMLSSSDAISTTVGNTNYNYIVMEPAQLAKLNNDLKTFNPNVVLNYIYYNQMNSQSGFLPWSIREEIEQWHEILSTKETVAKGKRRRTGIVPMKKRIRKIAEDISGIQFNCAAETMEQLQYANARVFIDNIYPTQESRKTIRNNVAKLASSILIGFRSMIDQLNWMSDYTKKGAYSKIENLVKNIAYPDWITVDSQLNDYHATLGISSFDDYFTVYNKASTFNMYQMWELLRPGSANRIDFNGPPGTTNAWYQPEMNSITFPAAILHQPFYDANWPAAVNFGAMGVIAGHELTHGFDDEGVQWNGVGALDGWMDATSQTSFTAMAGCVVNEYNGFCPLNKTVYGAGACVDGAQTQGENIADNGGIHAAFRAYKNYINLNGPDPQLPDGQLEGFTADQLFFMAFANVWCQMPPTDAKMNRQILVDPHSPSIYRVFGTIQNFPGFKDAFHCPANTAYAPDKHCNVWVSDISSSYGLPAVKQSDINVPVQPKAVQSDPATYTAYQQSVDFFKASVNFTADPCNDFWSYSCGNYNKLVSFHLADASNLVLMAQQLTDPNYQTTIGGSTALTKEKQFFDACVALTGNSTLNNNTLIQQNYIQKKVDALKTKLGNLPFTAVLGGNNVQLPTKTAMADSLGYLSFTQMIDTLITPMVDTYWIDNSKGYQFFIDQNSAEKSKTYYAPDAWANIRGGYLKSTVAVFQTYCTEQGIKCPADLNNRVGKILDFEQIIAYNYSTNDAARRQYMRSWNLMTVDKLNTNYNFVDWTEYLKQLPAVAVPIVTDPAYKISVMEPDMISKLSVDIQNSAKFDPDTVVNYLYMRLLLDNAQYLPSYQAAMELMPVTETGEVIIGKKRKQRLPRRQLADISNTQTSCIDLANSLMQFANGRVFIDYLYPTQADRDFIRQHVGGVITNIISSFQGMLMQLDWMSSEDKTRALQKTLGIIQNIAFPDWITTDDLDTYYAPLMFDGTDNYYTMWDKLIQFNIYIQYNQITMNHTDRFDFLGQPGTVNAWYQPELNSITFPAGILVPPYYNALWPASVNYGGLGVVAGHELTHGFDDEGVQWGPTGDLKQWMNNQSSIDGFQNMAQCVIDEYSGFCPLNKATYTPNCVDGQQTQGENIADNGGIHAAFRAYRTHIQLNGPDPMLPDQMFGQFTHDQLFFLSFGQVWCEAYRGDDGEYKQLMVDPHSPSKYRVFGTIQNYPAFQTAFHCPANSAYAPDKHCRVWVPNVEN